MCSHEEPINRQCILPPHMLEAIEMRGNKKQKVMVRTLQKQADKIREERNSVIPQGSYVVASAFSGAAPKADRAVYDAKNKATLPGTKVRGEGDRAVTDKAVNEAYNGAGNTFKLYRDVYQRNSLDGNGLQLVSSVHYRNNYNNAFWNGTQMAYGDGDGTIFKPLTKSLSVIGHELSHGIVQFSGGLIYRDQSGALNESFADVFGALTVQYKKKQSASEADWLMGGEILGPNINGEGLRSLKAPGQAYDDPLLGKDPQPFHMDDYINTAADYGGVHINSGIPNHAFYLLAQYIGGNAWETAGKIWYDTMQNINNPHATFSDWADETVSVARGIGTKEELFTRRAWKLVGIDV